MPKDFPLHTLEKIFKKAGAERISPSAAEELKLILLEITEKIGKNAVLMANHAKRATIKREDIRLAARW